MSRFYISLLLLFPIGISAQVTFNDDIAPILAKNCITCHSNGEIGPMPLVTYTEVASFATMIKFVTHIKLMPPFKANIHKMTYKNVRSLSKQEIETIEAWIDGGLLEGQSKPINSRNKPQKTEYDEVICMEESFEHYGIYYDQYQAFVLPLNNIEDKYVSQIDILPGNKEIVRSAYLSISDKGDGAGMDEWDPRYGFYAYGSLGFEATLPNWYSWMPNTDGLEINNNEYHLLPKDSELILHLHYGPYGEVQTDSTCIGLVFEDDINPKLQTQNVPLLSTEYLKDTFLLEADLKKRFSSTFFIPEDIYIKSITPLAYLLCRSWEVIAILPDSTALPLLSISDWDFHWREKYVFGNYIMLPKGSRIVGTATYDNTSNNPYNPSDPPHAMKHGPHMYNENYLCYFEFVNANAHPSATINKPNTVSKNSIQKLTFNCIKAGNYKLAIHDLSTGNSTILTEKRYPQGNHILQSSDLPSSKGRYAISISLESEVQDTWMFVIK